MTVRKLGLGLGAAGILASTALMGGSTAIAQPTGTYRVVAVTTTDGGTGEGVGDTFAFSGYLHRIGSQRRIGRFGVSCVITSVRREEANCTATARITRGQRQGQITIQGLLGDGRRQELAITGGTQDFDNAGGTLNTFDVTQRATRLTFHFSD